MRFTKVGVAGLFLCLVLVFLVSGKPKQEEQPFILPTTYYEIQKEELTFDAGCSKEVSGYVNDMLLVALLSDKNTASLQTICELVDGTPVGKLSGVPVYQVQVPRSSPGQLEALCQTIQQESLSGVLGVLTDRVFDWDDGLLISQEPVEEILPWQEVIQLRTSQLLMGVSKNALIGIVEHGFGEDCFDRLQLSDASKRQCEQASDVDKLHGSVVASILSGMQVDANEMNLCGDVYNGTVSGLFNSMLSCLQQGCKVIHVSQGLSFDSEDWQVALSRAYAGAYLTLFQEYGFQDFLIVQAAGDSGRNVMDGTGFFAGFQLSDVTAGVTDCLHSDLQGDWSEEQLYGLWQKLWSQILIVGNAKNSDCVFVDKEGIYSSCYGLDVDVYAPGVSICLEEGGGFVTGSSLTSAQAAGVASILAGCHPTFTGAQLRDCILGGALTQLDGIEGDEALCWLLDAEQAMVYAHQLETGRLRKLPVHTFTSRFGMDALLDAQLSIGPEFGDVHFTETDDWAFRIINAEGKTLHGQFYPLQMDRDGWLWLKVKPYSYPKKLYDKIDRELPYSSLYCSYDTCDMDVRDLSQIGIYEVFMPGASIYRLSEEVREDVQSLRDSSDWLVFGRTKDGKSVCFYE